MKEKSTRELMAEKEEMIKEYDQKIYESSQKSMARSRKERGERLAKKQQLEDDGWNSSYINPNPPVIEEDPIVELKVKAKHKHILAPIVEVVEEAIEEAIDIVEAPKEEELTEITKQKLIEKKRAELAELLGE